MKSILKAVATAALPFIVASSAFANEGDVLKLRDDAPKTYVVVKGDTLWDISKLYLDSPWLWPRLWQINPEIDNPHLIYPGDKLSLVWKNGQPVLSLKPVVKLSPKVRVTEKRAVPTVKESLILPYLQSDRLLDDASLEGAAKVVGSRDGRTFLSKGDRIYIGGEHYAKRWTIYRPVERYQRDEPEVNAHGLRIVATAELAEHSDKVTGLDIVKVHQEILPNDIALPVESVNVDELSTTFYPTAAPEGINAVVMGNMDGIGYSVKNQVVVLDRGQYDGLRQGSIFEVYQESAQVYLKGESFNYEKMSADELIELPESYTGQVMVIRPYEHFSLAIVTHSLEPLTKRMQLVPPLQGKGGDSTAATTQP